MTVCNHVNLTANSGHNNEEYGSMRKEEAIPFDWTDKRDKQYLDELVREFLMSKLGVGHEDLPENYGYTITVNWENGQ